MNYDNRFHWARFSLHYLFLLSSRFLRIHCTFRFTIHKNTTSFYKVLIGILFIQQPVLFHYPPCTPTMHYVLSAAQMRACDAFTINDLGVPSAVLMEDAALAATTQIRQVLAERTIVTPATATLTATTPTVATATVATPTVTLFCGSGNNGGDGFAIARHLCNAAAVQVVWVGGIEKMSAETLMNFRALERHAVVFGFPIIHVATEEAVQTLDWSGIAASDVVVDALVGVGGSEHPRGIVAMLIERLLNLTTLKLTALKIAIDLPTGLNADTGRAHEHCIRADMTLTMAALKRGMLLHDGPDVTGTVRVLNIGIPERVLATQSSVAVIEPHDVRLLLPMRARRTSKHDYGKVAIIGGSEGMLGAPALTANACLRAGAGLVRLCSVGVHTALRAEVMAERVAATDEGTIAESAFEKLWRAVEWSSVVVFGPGLGANAETLALGERLLMRLLTEHPDKPVIIDADGLRCLAPDDKLSTNVILTPHHGEFARLTGVPRSEVQSEAAELAVQWAQRLGCVMLLKNVPTIISDGERTFWNRTGNAGMATAGSGDVLAGIIAACCAQILPTLPILPILPSGHTSKHTATEAAALGAFLHGMAGDLAARRLSEQSLCASDIIDALPEAIATCL
jgi:NAD(P)H-hydrate epimerase